MNLIEKYLYNVTSRLPKKERAEVEKELRADIESMLQEDYNNIDVCNVLDSWAIRKYLRMNTVERNGISLDQRSMTAISKSLNSTEVLQSALGSLLSLSNRSKGPIIPFFQTEVPQRYYPAIFLLILAAITVGILKLVAGWTASWQAGSQVAW